MAKCKFCGLEIIWMKEGRKNVPVEIDGAKHECDQFKNSTKSIKKLKPSDIDPDILKEYQEKMNAKAKKK